MPADSAVGIALLHPELLGTYGDGGNALVLAQRLRWRGVDAAVLPVHAGEPVPASCEVAEVVLFGSMLKPEVDRVSDVDVAIEIVPKESNPERARAINERRVLELELLGRRFLGPDGSPHDGLGLLDCETTRGDGPRRVGELVVEADADLGLPPLTGYENHAGLTELGPGVRPLGRAVVGAGNAGDGREGAVVGRVVGTYLHGPALARNPALADLLLSWVLGRELAPVDDGDVDELRRERFAAALGGRARRRGWRRRDAIPVRR